MGKMVLKLALFALPMLPLFSAAGGVEELTEADKKIQEALGHRALTLQLWPEQAPDEDQKTGPESVRSPERENRGVRISDVGRPTMTIRRPERTGSKTPAVLVSPGGAYHSLAIEEEGVEIVKWLNSLGITGILLKYRVPRREDGFPKYHHALQDAQRAMGLIRHNAEAWGIDPDLIGVLGFSAGGHLSATISCNDGERLYEPIDEADEESCRPDFAVLVYPAYLAQGKAHNTGPEAVSEDLSPSSAPPTFIAVSQMDGVKRGCIVYLRALTRAGIPAELHVYEKGEHGGGMRIHPFGEWGEACSRWMEDRGIIRRH